MQWHRDVEVNSVAIATFAARASQLLIESEVVIQHYNQTPLDFLVTNYATNYPFGYTIAGTNHIAVAVARMPESVPPVSGSFVGSRGANLSVGVWVSEV